MKVLTRIVQGSVYVCVCVLKPLSLQSAAGERESTLGEDMLQIKALLNQLMCDLIWSVSEVKGKHPHCFSASLIFLLPLIARVSQLIPLRKQDVAGLATGWRLIFRSQGHLAWPLAKTLSADVVNTRKRSFRKVYYCKIYRPLTCDRQESVLETSQQRRNKH